ncbi:hypothetical protein RF847_004627 [Salmonella enterica]|nr:hypothetical protein [Salmonella enterica]
MNKELLLKYRSRITAAALLRMRRKAGSNCLVISTADKGLQTLEVTDGTMMALLGRFEILMRDEYGTTEGNKVIEYAYKNAINVNPNGEYLTDTGKLIVDDLIKEATDYVKSGTSGAIK